MPRPRRAIAPTVPSVLILFAALTGCRSAGAPASPAAAAADAPRQIHWQRSLDDALAVAKAQGLPLLLAVNMDGESASDRVPHEQYHDPAFVAATRHFVCLAASVFRHTPNDYDADGRRIPCPRLGGCTCGEHMALEPLLHERFLADGERVAPRHAVIGVDGAKVFDLSLSFDLRDIDRAVAGSAGAAVLRPTTAADWSGLAAARDAAGRAALEHAVTVADEAGLAAALAAVAAHGDAGSLDALRLVGARLPALSVGLRERFVATVAARGLGGAVGALLRERLGGFGDGGAPPAGGAELAAVLVQVDGASPATQALLRARGGAFAIADVLAAAAVTRTAAAGAPPLAGGPDGTMPSAEQLVAELETLDGQLRERRDDPALLARYAKASLDLARRHMETQQRDVAVLLADAEQSFRRALATDPAHPDWWIERARTAWCEQRFGDQVAHGRAAVRAAIGVDAEELPAREPLAGPMVVEALRWVADGEARRYTTLLADEPAAAGAAITAALRAFGAVAASACGTENDWVTFASFCGSLGLAREQFLAARAGALRFPGSRPIRESLHAALWQAGRAGDVVTVADAVLEELGAGHPGRADALWFVGFAGLLAAENDRRAERLPAARQHYALARERFAAAAAARADYRDNCRYMVALAHLGDGLAAVGAGQRQQGADDLVLAVASWSNLGAARDGLGYDVLDLVDKIGEWRADGPSPVDVLSLAQRLDAVVPDDAFYVVALADSQLREALRADGRNPVRTERDTVDAAGRPIRMLLGVPNDEGDAYLLRALQLLRSRRDRLVSEEDRITLAQCATIWAERQFERGRREGVAAALREAAEVLGIEGPPVAEDDALATLQHRCSVLRHRLGEARPRWRDGR